MSIETFFEVTLIAVRFGVNMFHLSSAEGVRVSGSCSNQKTSHSPYQGIDLKRLFPTMV